MENEVSGRAGQQGAGGGRIQRFKLSGKAKGGEEGLGSDGSDRWGADRWIWTPRLHPARPPSTPKYDYSCATSAYEDDPSQAPDSHDAPLPPERGDYHHPSACASEYRRQQLSYLQSCTTAGPQVGSIRQTTTLQLGIPTETLLPSPPG